MDVSDDDMVESPKIKAVPKIINLNLLSEKSRYRYEKQYKVFSTWCSENQMQTITEEVLLTYFIDKSKVFQTSTLWRIFSMLRATIMKKHDIEIRKYKKLMIYLKKQPLGFQPKKSETLKRNEILKFLTEAPDNVYLMKKVVLIIGIAGACRRDELANLTIDDIDDRDTIIIVKILDMSTKIGRTFILSNDGCDSVDLLSYYRKYRALRPPNLDTRKLFIKYAKGKCYPQILSLDILSKIPRSVAAYLRLPNLKTYNINCFRSSATSLLESAEGGLSKGKKRPTHLYANILPSENTTKLKIENEDSAVEPNALNVEDSVTLENDHNSGTNILRCENSIQMKTEIEDFDEAETISSELDDSVSCENIDSSALPTEPTEAQNHVSSSTKPPVDEDNAALESNEQDCIGENITPDPAEQLTLSNMHNTELSAELAKRGIIIQNCTNCTINIYVKK